MELRAPVSRHDTELPSAARRFFVAMAAVVCAVAVFAVILPPPAKGHSDTAQATLGTLLANAIRALTVIASPPTSDTPRPAFKGAPGGIRN